MSISAYSTPQDTSAGTAFMGARPGDGRTPGQSAVSIPLYVAALFVLLSGVMAVAYSVDSPAFMTFCLVTTLLGVTTSYFLRHFGVPPRWIMIGALGLSVVLIYALRGEGLFEGVIPPEARMSSDLLFACALALTAIFCSFLLITDDAVVFICVWPIALIGLTGVYNVNREQIVCYFVFLVAAAFLLVHQMYLQNRPVKSAPGAWGRLRLLKRQAFLALACTVAAVATAFPVAVLAQMVGRNLSLATVIRRLSVPTPPPTSTRGNQSGLSFDDYRRFDVGLGPVSDDPTNALSVEIIEGETPHLWRGRTFSVYTGHGWEGSPQFSPRSIRPGPGSPRDPGSFSSPEGLAENLFWLPPAGGPRAKVTRNVHRFIPQGGGGVLYVAAEPHSVRARLPLLLRWPDNTLGVPYFDYFSGVREYEVVSDVSNATPDDLRQSGGTYPASVADYRITAGTTADFNPVLAQLAAEATAGATTAYDKAEAIRRWVSARCVYTLSAPAVPRGEDVTEHFLNVTKTGYCDLYATAVAVLCRYAGLPVRVATGFLPGTPSPTNPRRFDLMGRDRHAWAEVYFPGYGWIPFDATDGTRATTLVAPSSAQNPLAGFFSNIAARGPLPLLLGALGLAALLWVLKTEVWDRLVTARRPATLSGAASDVIACYGAAVRALARRGVARPAAMTPAAYVGSVHAYLGSAVSEPLRALTIQVEQALYGPAMVTDEEAAAARQGLRAVRAALKQTRGGRSLGSQAVR